MTEHDWFTSDDALMLLDHLFPMRGMDSVGPQSRSSRFYLQGCAAGPGRATRHLPGGVRAYRAHLPRPRDRSAVVR